MSSRQQQARCRPFLKTLALKSILIAVEKVGRILQASGSRSHPQDVVRDATNASIKRPSHPSFP